VVGETEAQATQAASTSRRKGRDVGAQCAARAAWAQRRAGACPGQRSARAPHPGDHPDGAIAYAPSALSRPPTAGGNGHHAPAGRPEKIEIYFPVSPLVALD
jgi:hypothetical protein